MTEGSTTVYLRGIPRRVVREAKAAAARRGMTLAKLVTEALERALQGSAEPTEAVEERFDLDAEWYAKNRTRLARRYDGEYLAIVDREIVDHDPDFESLAGRVLRRVGGRPVFMPRAGSGEQRVRVRSPRRRSA